MTIWAMEGQEGALVAYVPDRKLSKAMAFCGVQPIAVREVFKTARVGIFDLQLGMPSALKVESKSQSIPDIVFWSWIAIFSRRATLIAITLGCEQEEFWPCRFQSNPKEEFFFHLPIKAFDVVDIDKSMFRQILPVTPPIPMFMDSLVTKPLPDNLPPCFRAEIPRAKSVFSELLVRDEFKDAWDQQLLRGAVYRQLST
jgi:hypothetical protein